MLEGRVAQRLQYRERADSLDVGVEAGGTRVGRDPHPSSRHFQNLLAAAKKLAPAPFRSVPAEENREERDAGKRR
eukprot:6173977-Pleurochrysis_carterae.AAC.3